jgi:hypothetical protein
MDDNMLCTVFMPTAAASEDEVTTFYLFLVSKDVSSWPGVVAARNVTIRLHHSVAAANVVGPGVQGPTGFDLSGDESAGLPRKNGGLHRHYANVHVQQNNNDHPSALAVTVELVGGGGSLVKVSGSRARMQAAAYGKADIWFDPSTISLAGPRQGGSKLKGPEWVYGTFKQQGDPLNNLEVSDGKGFEGGEQTPFIIGGSMVDEHNTPLTGPQEAKAWAWASYNLLLLQMPPVADLNAYGPQSKAFGDLLDWGFSFEYFGLLEPRADKGNGRYATNSSSSSSSGLLALSEITAGVDAYRCHGRFGGLILADNAANASAVLERAAVLKTSARAPWLLPFVASASAEQVMDLGYGGIPLAMPL